MNPNYLIDKDEFHSIVEAVKQRIKENSDYPMSEKSIELRGNKAMLDYIATNFEKLPESEEFSATGRIIICKKVREPLIDGFHESQFFKFNSQQEVLEAYKAKIKELELNTNVYGRMVHSYAIDPELLTFTYDLGMKGQYDYFPVNKFSSLDNF